MQEEVKPSVAEQTEPEQENKELRSRFRIERVAFIIIVAIIAGVWGGNKTDLGTFGLVFMVAIMMSGLYYAVNFFVGVGGGFYERVLSEEYVPDFDWKRFAREPLYLIVVFIAGLILGGIYWVLTGRNR